MLHNIPSRNNHVTQYPLKEQSCQIWTVQTRLFRKLWSRTTNKLKFNIILNNFLYYQSTCCGCGLSLPIPWQTDTNLISNDDVLWVWSISAPPSTNWYKPYIKWWRFVGVVYLYPALYRLILTLYQMMTCCGCGLSLPRPLRPDTNLISNDDVLWVWSISALPSTDQYKPYIKWCVVGVVYFCPALYRSILT